MSDISVKAVFADGTTEIITISGDTYVTATVDDATDPDNPTIDNTAAFSTKAVEGEAECKKLSDAKYDKVRDEIADVMIGQVFSYTESDKEYKVGDLDASEGGVSTGKTLKKGENTIDDDVTANSKSVYVLTSNGNTYTGYRNLPSMTDVTLTYVLDENSDGIASLVFITSKTDADDENAYFFFVADETKHESKKDGSDTVYTFTAAYVNGEQQDVVVNGEVKGAIVAGGPGLYKTETINTKDVVTALKTAECKDLEDDMSVNQATAAGSETLIVDGTNYTYDSKTVFVYVDGDKVSVGEASDIIVDPDAEEGDEITWVYISETDDDGIYAEVVYIIVGEQPAGGAPGGHTHNLTWSSEVAKVNPTCENDGAPAHFTATCDVAGCTLDSSAWYAAKGSTTEPGTAMTAAQKVLTKLGHNYQYADDTDDTKHIGTCQNDSSHKTTPEAHTWVKNADTGAHECATCGGSHQYGQTAGSGTACGTKGCTLTE